MTSDVARHSFAILANRKALLGLSILGFFAVLVLFGPLLVAYDPTDFVASPNEAPSRLHWLGTTGQGADVLAQSIIGARTSLLIGFGVGIGVTLMGALIGMTGAFFGGWVDDLLSLLTNIFLVMPGLPFAVVVAAYLPRGPITIAAVLVFTGWAWAARVLRAQTLSIREKDFVAAAIVSGEGSFRIMFREILPNMTSLMVSGFIGATVYAIGAQVGLEFLGLGDPSAVTWGTNLYWANNNSALLMHAWWSVVPTGLSIALVGFALVEINYAIDEIGNPRLKPEEAFKRLLKAEGLRPGLATPVLRAATAHDAAAAVSAEGGAP